MARLAMMPPVLLAAERVELARFDVQLLARAALLWRVARWEYEASDLADVLWAWWQTYMNGATRWPVAVAALAEMTK